MKIGIISDTHGNAYVLERSLARLRSCGVGRIFHLGDAIGYFGEPHLVVSMLLSHGAHCLLGNHEAMYLGIQPVPMEKAQLYALEKAAALIDLGHRAVIEGWTPWHEETIDGVKLLFVHGSPWDPLCGRIYPNDNLPSFRFDRLGYDAVFMGHTHRPFVFQCNQVTATNVGSCGLPRDCGKLSSLAVYDTSNRSCRVERFEFSVDEVVRHYEVRDLKLLECLGRQCGPGSLVGEMVKV